jgi:hypothetical protein
LNDASTGTRVRITFGASAETPALLVGRTLADLNALYELVAVLADRKYEEVLISKDWRFRRESRLPAEDQLRVEDIQLGSPLELVVFIPVAVHFFLKALERVVGITKGVQEIRLLDVQRQREQIALTGDEVDVESRQIKVRRDRIAERREEIALAKEEHDLERLVEAREAVPAFELSTRRLAGDLPIEEMTTIQEASES